MRASLHIAALLLAASWIAPAAAQSAATSSYNEIGHEVLAGARGNMAINSSSGNGNAQNNAVAIAVGGHASADLRSRQQAAGNADAGDAYRAAIGERAFHGASGIVAVNQSSGNGNAQANLVAIAAGRYAEVSIDHLGTVSATPPTAASAGEALERNRERRAMVADSAFSGATGVVQLNQLAGSGNNTVNAFAVSVAP